MRLSFLLFFLTYYAVSGQNANYSILTISDSLKQNANAVVRLSELKIDITSQKAMTIKSRKVTTVLNELGLRNLDLVESYLGLYPERLRKLLTEDKAYYFYLNDAYVHPQHAGHAQILLENMVDHDV